MIGLWSGYIAMQAKLATMVADLVVSEADYLITGTIPVYASSKLHLPSCPLLQVEMSNVQGYVALLAAHDLGADYATAPFAVAAFDLSSTSSPNVQLGLLARVRAFSIKN